jgi:uncharacterized phage infection (PIP) family protein YhgE
MLFDPTKPVEDSPLDAAEMRGQFNALKGLTDDLAAQANNFQAELDGLPSNDGMIDWLTDNSARNVDGIQPLTLTLSGPLTQAQGQALLDKLNQLIAGLHH